MTSVAWNLRRVGQLCNFSSGHGFSRHDLSEEGLPIIRIGHLNGLRKFDYYAGIPDVDWIVEPGELLFAWAGTRGVSFGPSIWSGPRGVLNQHIFKVKPIPGVDIGWLFFALSEITASIERRAHGFKTTLLHVRKEDIETQRCLVPPEPMQQKIASTLILAGRLGGLKKQLGSLTMKRKSGLAKQLLTGKKRFPPFRSREWSIAILGEHVKPVKRKNGHGCELVLTASGEHGLVDQREYFNRKVSATDLSGYYALKRGEFAYNRSAMNGYPYGAIKRLDAHDEGVLSTLYLCFAIDDAKLDSNFLRNVFDSGLVNPQLRRIVRVGARAHGLLNVADSDFLAMRIPFPGLDEQKAIAGVLDGLDEEIGLLNKQRQQYDLYKRGLMQRLLSGEIQVTA